MAIAGLILAGGRSSRMGGRDKAFVPLAGRPLIAHAIARLGRQVGPLAINTNAQAEAFAGYGLPLLADEARDYSGPLAGVLAGLDWAAAEGHSHIVSVAVDTPFFPDDLAARLRDAQGEAGLSLAATDGPDGHWRHPTFGLWPVALRDDLRAALADGTRKIVLWADRHAPGKAVFDAHDHDPFFNINTPEDLETAERMIAAA
jgi:molybdopterin-guanine dinucleotide biosynthesis protein A